MAFPVASRRSTTIEESLDVAEVAGPRKRLKEINAEIAAAKQKIATLKAEREQLREKVKAQAAKADKPA